MVRQEPTLRLTEVIAVETAPGLAEFRSMIDRNQAETGAHRKRSEEAGFVAGLTQEDWRSFEISEEAGALDDPSQPHKQSTEE